MEHNNQQNINPTSNEKTNLNTTTEKNQSNYIETDTNTIDLTDTLNNILDEINLTSIAGKKSGKKKSKLKNLTNMNSMLDSELTIRIQTLNQEVKNLRTERENLNESLFKHQEIIEDKDKQLEILEEKLKNMKEIITKCEKEINELSLQNSKNEFGGISSQEADKLQDENLQYKRLLNDKETQIEILTLNNNELTKTNSEMSKLNDNLKDQISKRRYKEEVELNKLLELNNQLEKEKSDLEKKFKEYLEYASNNSSLNSSLPNYTSNLNEKDISDFKKQVSNLKAENKNLNKKFEEMATMTEIEIGKLKAEISEKEDKINELLKLNEKIDNNLQSTQKENKDLFEANRKFKELNQDLQMKINHLEKSSENLIDLATVKFELEQIIKRKDNEIRDLASQNETNSQLNERNKKMESALRNELKLKENEITKRNDIIKAFQDEIDKISDENLAIKKENFNLKARGDIKETEISNNLEGDLKVKIQEISNLKDNESKYEKFIIEMKEIINKKQAHLNNKKKINTLLIDIIKIKRGEVQCLEALKFTSSTNLRDNLTKIRENEKILLAKVDEITNDPDFEDDSDDEDDEIGSDIGSDCDSKNSKDEFTNKEQN